MGTAASIATSNSHRQRHQHEVYKMLLHKIDEDPSSARVVIEAGVNLKHTNSVSEIAIKQLSRQLSRNAFDTIINNDSNENSLNFSGGSSGSMNMNDFSRILGTGPRGINIRGNSSAPSYFIDDDELELLGERIPSSSSATASTSASITDLVSSVSVPVSDVSTTADTVFSHNINIGIPIPSKKKKPDLYVSVSSSDFGSSVATDYEYESSNKTTEGGSEKCDTPSRALQYMQSKKSMKRTTFENDHNDAGDADDGTSGKGGGDRVTHGSYSVPLKGEGELLRVSPKGTVSLPQLGTTRFEIGDFVELAHLGNGSSGAVVEALHVPTLSLVALKMLPVYNHEKRVSVARELQVLYRNLEEMNLIHEDSLNEESKSNRNINDEESSKIKTATAVGGAKNQNVLGFMGAFSDTRSGMINLVIEYMDGGSLQDLVEAGGTKNEMVIADIARQTLSGLSYLHSFKSVHRGRLTSILTHQPHKLYLSLFLFYFSSCPFLIYPISLLTDIKPANILCSSRGVIKIADFGISIVLDNTAGFAQSFVGTVCYMSPERITGETYSFSSDVWSFGLTMLAVAFGKFPINSDSMSGGYWGMMRAITDDPPPLPGPEFSASFNEFIDLCLQKEPKKRASAASLLEHLFVVQNSKDEIDNNFSTPPTSTTKTATSTSSRHHSFTEAKDTKNMHDFSVSTMTPPHSRRGSVSENDPQTPLSSELTSAITRRRSRDVSDQTMGILHMSGFEMIDAIRLEHLNRILQKLSARVERLKREGFHIPSVLRASKGNKHSATNSNSNYIDDGNNHDLYSSNGDSKWLLLSDQLHLPLSLVSMFATARLNPIEPLNHGEDIYCEGEGGGNSYAKDLFPRPLDIDGIITDDDIEPFND